MFIQTEQTPNPQTLKFLPGKVVMDEGTAFYQNINEAGDSPFARRLFDVEGVEGVFFGSDFITISKNDKYDWQVMKPSVLGGIIDHVFLLYEYVIYCMKFTQFISVTTMVFISFCSCKQ
jgi:hypothetical protein